MNTTLKNRLILLAILAFLTLAVLYFGLNELWINKLYSIAFYPTFASGLRIFSSAFDFPIGDVLYCFLGLMILIRLFFLIRRYHARGFQRMDWYIIPIRFANFLLILFLVFKLSWGLNYDRPPIAQSLQIADNNYTPDQLVSLGNYFLVKLNSLKPIIDSAKARPVNYSIDFLKNKSAESFAKLALTNKIFSYPNPCLKACLFADPVTKSGIEGYYNPLSGEANVNMQLVPFVLPFTTCHEIAHQIGIAKEDEANLIGYIAAINSNDINFQYAAYYCMFRSILWEISVKSPEDYLLITDQIDPSVKKDFEIERDFWMRNNSDMSKYMGSAFDRLLKLNKQKKGIKSYQDIVLWLYNFHKDEL